MNFYETITAAIKDFAEHGFDTQQRLLDWVQRIRQAAVDSLIPQEQLRTMLDAAMSTIFNRLVNREGVLKTQPGISRYTLEKVKPQLRAELDRRIMASAQLIKLNREEMIERTLRRFQGWATSIPAGGSQAVEKKAESAVIRKSLAQLPFTERRVMIDQGHKLTSAINEICAVEQGAIAARWRSHWRQPGYNYREDHKERDQQIYLIRGNWAQEKGLCKVGDAGYYDDITHPGQEIFCRCSATYLFSLRDLPDSMLTAKGRAKLNAAKL